LQDLCDEYDQYEHAVLDEEYEDEAEEVAQEYAEDFAE